MRLSKTTSHAIRIAIDCAASEGALVKVADVARRLDISQLNVFKIVHILSRAGFVEAQRGRNGGIRLARAAETIRIGEIVRAIEATEIEVAGANTAPHRIRRSARPGINEIFGEALEAFIGVLDQHTLADMVRGARGLPPQTAALLRKPRQRAARAAMRDRAVFRG